MEKSKPTPESTHSQLPESIQPLETPHFEVGRFCGSCPHSTILHTGCESDGTVKEFPVPTPIVKGGS